MDLVTKARLLEIKIRVQRENKKKIKQQAYRAFLQNPDRDLPDYQTINKWRNMLFYATATLIVIPSLTILFFYHTPRNPLFYELLYMPHLIAFMLLSFALSFDRVISKRWPERKTIMNWHTEHTNEQDYTQG